MSRFEKKHDVVTIRTRNKTQNKSHDGINIIMPVEHGELPVAHEYHRHEYHPHPPSDTRYKSSNDQNVTIVETHKYYESDSDLALRQHRVRRSSSHEEQESQLLADNRRLREELEEHLRQLERMRHDTESLSEKVDHLMRERERIDKDHDTEIHALKKRVKDLEAIRSDLESKLEHRDNEMNGNNESLEQEIQRLQEELDRRADMIESMSAEHQHTLSKMITIEREKSLLRQIDNLAGKATKDKHCIDERTAEIEALKSSHIPIHREAELLEKIRKLSATLTEKEAEISQFHHLAEEKQKLKLEVERLRNECERLRHESKSTEHVTTHKSCECHGGENPLKDLVREQESHIADLRREIDSLKIALANSSKKECRCANIKKAATEENIVTESKNTIIEDHFNVGNGCPKCLLEEKSRLLTSHQKPAFSTQTIVKVDNSKELDEATKNLHASRMRIKQLEQWLNQVYTDHSYETMQSVPPPKMTPVLPPVDYHIKQDTRRMYTKKPTTNLTGNLTGLITDRHANCSDNCVHHRRRHLDRFA